MAEGMLCIGGPVEGVWRALPDQAMFLDVATLERPSTAIERHRYWPVPLTLTVDGTRRERIVLVIEDRLRDIDWIQCRLLSILLRGFFAEGKKVTPDEA